MIVTSTSAPWRSVTWTPARGTSGPSTPAASSRPSGRWCSTSMWGQSAFGHDRWSHNYVFEIPNNAYWSIFTPSCTARQSFLNRRNTHSASPWGTCLRTYFLRIVGAPQHPVGIKPTTCLLQDVSSTAVLQPLPSQLIWLLTYPSLTSILSSQSGDSGS